MMRVTAPKKEADVIVNKLRSGEHVKRMNILTHPVTATKIEISPKPVFKATFNVEAVNTPGILYKGEGGRLT
jgi:hypothetical protein